MNNSLSYTIQTNEEVLKALNTSVQGLSEQEVKNRQANYGHNAFEEKKLQWFSIFLQQISSPFIYLLMLIFFIALFLENYSEAGMILFFISLNTIIGFYQEYKVEQTGIVLKKYMVPMANVRRAGKNMLIPSASLVPGDIVIIEAGDSIPADIRFIKESHVFVDESPMTGESAPVKKIAGPLQREPEQRSQASNIGAMGTIVVAGKAIGVVIAIAQETILGSRAQMAKRTKHETIFEREIRSFSQYMVLLMVSTILIVVMLNILFKGIYVPLGQLFIFSIALAVTIVPDALPIVVTFCLSRGALKLVRNKVIVKRLSAIEDLGSIEILCSDETGILTENIFSVVDIYGYDKAMVLKYANGAASFVVKDHAKHRINPIDQACWAALTSEQQREVEQYIIAYEVPFNHERLRNTVVIKHKGNYEMIVRGIIEIVLDRCHLDAPQKKEIISWARQQESQARRVLVIAKKEISKNRLKEETQNEQGCDFVGLLALADPIKKEVKQALARAKQLDVTVKILTEDSPYAAACVGKEIGLIISDEHVITGAQFKKLTNQEKKKATHDYTMFARVEPQQKFEIVQLLQETKQVGYVGDGINDASAMKAAHVTMAIQGATEVAYDTTDIILLKKSLQVIIDGIYEGRTVFANTVKYLKISFSTAFANFYSVALASLFLNFLPMLPLQILLINLLSDFPLIALATDNVDSNEVYRPNTFVFKEIFLLSLMIAVVSCSCDFMMVYLFYRISPAVLQTNWFIESILTSIVSLYSLRTELPFFKAKMPSSSLVGLTAFAIIITLGIPLTSFGQKVFSFVPPTQDMYLTIFLIVVFCFIGTELVKLLYYRMIHKI